MPPKVKGIKGGSGIARVTDYAIRQSFANGPFELMWHLQFQLAAHRHRDGDWWSASGCV